jgi:hypothetical protein
MSFATNFGLQPIFGGGGDDELDSEAVRRDGSEKTTHHSDNQSKSGVGLMIPIALLVPLFIIKTSEAVIPNLDCTKASNAQLDMCEADQKKRGDAQYILELVLSFLGLIIAFALARYKSTSRAAILGLAYGSMLGLLYAVVTNSGKFNSPLQMLIIGVILVSLIFLPRVTDAGLMLEPTKNAQKEQEDTDFNDSQQNE